MDIDLGAASVPAEALKPDRSAKLRAFFARYVAERGGVQDPRIEQAFAAVPREPFAGPPPWFIVGPIPFFPSLPQYVEAPDDDPAFLYQDTLICLDKSKRINIGDPAFHAFCLGKFEVERNDAVLHVGAGSGYYTAILAHLVGPGGRVDAYEIDETLAARARSNLAHLAWVEVHARSGAAGDLPQADRIYVCAAATRPDLGWLHALKPGGRLLFPLQAKRGMGAMLLVHRPLRDSVVWAARFVTRAIFYACEGLQEAEAESRLAGAFDRGASWLDVRSLRLDENVDDTCWCRGEGWWLSTSSPEDTRARVAASRGP
jgi:protein-L-isoaspartate(D-aspartate) O-methyltransferase